MLAGALAAVLFAITVFEVAARDRILPGVSAVGHPVGWLDQSQAAAQIGPNLDAFLDRSVQIQYQNRVWTYSSRDLGMRGDADELAAAAYRVGREGSILSRFGEHVRALIGGTSVSVDSGVDQATLDGVIDQVASDVDRSPRDAHISISTDGTVEHVAARAGLTTDQASFRTRVLKALADGSTTVDLPVREEAPAVSDDLVQPAFTQVTKMLGGAGTPLTLTRGQESWPLDRADVAAVISVEGGTPDGQKATVTIDDQKLQDLVRKAAREIDQQVQEPRFAFNGGNLTVIKPSREGRTLDQPATVALIKAKLLGAERTAEIPVSAVPPSISSENPAALGIVERIETSSTSFSGSVPEKKWNIQLAAERLNGVVVPPGATFSFNKEVGPTTIESGFKWGFGIETSKEGAHTVPSIGGGICQVATTLFHPVFWAGYPLEERFWHLYWIPAYTSKGVVGLDVTVDEDSNLDFRWTNPTNDYILIQSATDDDRVYFSLYGKKPPWRVEVDDPVITNRVPPDPKPAFDEDPTMPWGRRMVVQTAREGFEVTVNRKVIPNGGGDPRTLRLRSKYQAVPTLTLVGTEGRPPGAPIPGKETPTTAPSAQSAPSSSAAPDAAAPPASTTPGSSSSSGAPTGTTSGPGTAGSAAVDQNRPAGSGAPSPVEQTGGVPSMQGAVALTPITRPAGANAAPPPVAPAPAPQGQSSSTSSTGIVAPVVGAGNAQQLSGATRP